MHTNGGSPFQRIGKQDITAHVNLSELETGLQNLGYEQLGPIPQHEFLTKLGIGNLVESARTDLGNYFERRQAFQALTDAGGLGKIQILAGLRGIKGTAPGFEGDNSNGLGSHKRFQERDCFPFPLISDFHGEVIQSFGLWNADEQKSFRSIVVIDQNKTILHIEPHFNPSNLNAYAAIFETLELTET